MLAVSSLRSWKAGARPRSVTIVGSNARTGSDSKDPFGVTGTSMGIISEGASGKLGSDVAQLCEQSVPV